MFIDTLVKLLTTWSKRFITAPMVARVALTLSIAASNKLSTAVAPSRVWIRTLRASSAKSTSPVIWPVMEPFLPKSAKSMVTTWFAEAPTWKAMRPTLGGSISWLARPPKVPSWKPSVEKLLSAPKPSVPLLITMAEPLRPN